MVRDDGSKGQLWSSGATYESYGGRWSRLVAVEFLRWLEPPSGRDWLDVGCGTGALCEASLGSPPTPSAGITSRTPPEQAS